MANPIFKVGDMIQYLDKEKNSMFRGEVVGVNQYADSNSYIIVSPTRNITISETELIKNIYSSKEN